jgi:hypothetical protein
VVARGIGYLVNEVTYCLWGMTVMYRLVGLAKSRPGGSNSWRRAGVGFGAALAGILLSACAAPRMPAPVAGTAPLEISQATNDALQEYLALIHPNRRGAFAVSLDGNNSYAYYCPEMSCQSNLFGGVSTSQCESLSGQECVLLYASREPRVAYSVAGDKGVAGRHGVRRGRPLDELNLFNPE